MDFLESFPVHKEESEKLNLYLHLDSVSLSNGKVDIWHIFKKLSHLCSFLAFLKSGLTQVDEVLSMLDHSENWLFCIL